MLQDEIMKLQTYKTFEGEDTVYVERDDVLEVLKQQPCEAALSPTVEPVGLEEAKKLIYQEWESKVVEDNPNQRLLVAYQIAMKALEQEPTTWSLDDAREDFMYDVYNTLDFFPTNNEANRIIDSFDRVTSGLNQQACEDCISRQDVLDIDFERIMLTTAKPIEMIEQKVKALPRVIPQQKVGRWMVPKVGRRMAKSFHKVYCDNCGFDFDIMQNESMDKMKYCPNCGAKMEGEYD